MTPLQHAPLGKIKVRTNSADKKKRLTPSADVDTSSPITFRHWKVFHAVHDCGSFSEAAVCLHLSQPTICYTIARLEKYFGISLYYVEGRKVVVTDAGKALLERSRNLLKGAIALEGYAHDLNDTTIPRLLFFVENFFPTSQIESFAKQFPMAEVIVDAIGSKSLPRVLNGELPSFALSSSVPDGFVGEPLIEMDYVAVVRSNHPLANRANRLDGPILEGIPEVVFSSHAQSGWARPDTRGLVRGNPLVVSNIDTALEVIAATTAYAWLPRCLLPLNEARSEFPYTALHDAGTFTRSFYLVRKIDPAQDGLFMQFAAMLKTSIASLQQ